MRGEITRGDTISREVEARGRGRSEWRGERERRESGREERKRRELGEGEGRELGEGGEGREGGEEGGKGEEGEEGGRERKEGGRGRGGGRGRREGGKGKEGKRREVGTRDKPSPTVSSRSLLNITRILSKLCPPFTDLQFHPLLQCVEGEGDQRLAVVVLVSVGVQDGEGILIVA